MEELKMHVQYAMLWEFKNWENATEKAEKNSYVHY